MQWGDMGVPLVMWGYQRGQGGPVPDMLLFTKHWLLFLLRLPSSHLGGAQCDSGSPHPPCTPPVPPSPGGSQGADATRGDRDAALWVTWGLQGTPMWDTALP